MGRVMRNPTPAKPGQTRRVLSALMCPPMHYTVCYSINRITVSFWISTAVTCTRSPTRAAGPSSLPAFSHWALSQTPEGSKSR